MPIKIADRRNLRAHIGEIHFLIGNPFTVDAAQSSHTIALSAIGSELPPVVVVRQAKTNHHLDPFSRHAEGCSGNLMHLPQDGHRQTTELARFIFGNAQNVQVGIMFCHISIQSVELLQQVTGIQRPCDVSHGGSKLPCHHVGNKARNVAVSDCPGPANNAAFIGVAGERPGSDGGFQRRKPGFSSMLRLVSNGIHGDAFEG